MNTKILINPDSKLAEDNIKLLTIRRRNEIISGYKFVKENGIESILLNTFSISYDPLSHSKTNLKVKIKMPLRKVKTEIKNFVKRKKIKISRLILLDKNYVQSYRHLIQVIDVLNTSNKKCILLVNWHLNDFEKHLIMKYQYIYINREAWILNGTQLILNSSLKFLSRLLELDIVHIGIVNSELHKEEKSSTELAKEVDLDISDIKQARVFLTISSIKDTNYWVDFDYGIKNYQWKNFLGKKIPTIKNIYVIVEKKNLDLGQISYLINDDLCVVANKDEMNMRQRVRVDLPGSLYPLGEIDFEDEILKVIEGGTCVSFRTNGKNKIEIHKYKQESCRPIMKQEIKFVNPKGLFPITLMVKNSNQKNFKKNIGIVLPPYTKISGGIVALYKLHDLLAANGYFVNTLPYHSGGIFPYNPRIQSIFRQEPVSDPSEYPWIYSDTISSLPFLVENQIQWQLNKPGYLPATSLGSFPVKPKYKWVYSAVFDDSNSKKLFVNNYDFDLFYPRLNSEKNFNSIYFGKPASMLTNELLNKLSENDFFIRRDNPPREYLPDLLTASRLLISLDPVSALNIEANLCGTPTLVLGDKSNFFKELDIRKFELPTNGIYFDESIFESIPIIDSNFHEHFKAETTRLELETQQNFLTFLEKICK